MKLRACCAVLSFLAVSASAQTPDDLIAAARAQRKMAAAPPIARSAGSVDLSGQISTAANPPNQGNIGDCHAFGSAAVLSAAFYRESHRKVVFSAGDLFVQDTLLNPGYTRYLAGAPMGLSEGAMPQSDLQCALDHGLATESDVPYSTLYRSYLQRIKPENMKDMNEADASGLLTRMLNLEQLPETRPQAESMRDSALKGEASLNQSRIDRLYRRKFPEIVAERERMREIFQAGGFKVVSAVYPAQVSSSSLPYPQSGAKDSWGVGELSPANCLALGQKQRQFLLEQLSAGRPVVVSMDLAGLASWSAQNLAEGQGYHAFVILGYRQTPAGLAFTTLNSWGPGMNRPVGEQDLCRIYSIDTVRIASDAR